MIAFFASCSILFNASDNALVDGGEANLDAGTDSTSANISDDFETGDINSRWRRDLENGDSCTVTDTEAASGTYSLRCQTDSASGSKAAIYLDFDPIYSIRVEMDVRFEASPNPFVDFLQAGHVTSTENLRLINADFYSSNQIDAWNFQTTQYEYVNQRIEENTWYHIVFEGTISSTNGSVRVVVDNDDSSAAHLQNIDTTDKPITRMSLGITLLNNSIEPHVLYIDNVLISEM